MSEANEKLLELETAKSDVSPRTIRNSIKPIVGTTLIPQAQFYLDGLKAAGKFNRYSADEPRIKRFKEFLKGEDISFQDISVTLLNRFSAYLKSTRKISDRTIVNHLVVIRSIFSQAIKTGLVDFKYYPFGKNKIRIKFPESVKIGLSSEEVTSLETLKLSSDSSANHARNIWLFSFYFAGMRLSDVLRLRWTDFQNERLHYTMGKNAKSGSLKIPQKALNILSQYKGEKRSGDDLVFPDLKMLDDLTDAFMVQKKIKNADHRLNEALREVKKAAGLNKKLTMHIARHTFGNISGEKIPVQMLQKLYRHSSITTTIGYQGNFIHKDADEALDAVVSLK